MIKQEVMIMKNGYYVFVSALCVLTLFSAGQTVQAASDGPLNLEGLWLHVPPHVTTLVADPNARAMSMSFSGNTFVAIHYFYLSYPFAPHGSWQLVGNPVGGQFGQGFPWQEPRGPFRLTRGSTKELLPDESLWRVTTTGTFTLEPDPISPPHRQDYFLTFFFTDGTSLRINAWYRGGVFQFHGGVTETPTGFFRSRTAQARVPAAPQVPMPQTPAAPIPGVRTSARQTHLDVLVPSLAVSMDPIGSNDTASAEFSKLVFQTLFRLDYDTSSPIPELVTRYRFDGPQTIHFTIRQGVTFHNGDPLTAHDVAFSLNTAGASIEMAIVFNMIDVAVAHSNTELTLHLNIPFAPIRHHLAHPGASIVPMNHIQRVGREAFATNPVGSGAFEFVGFVFGIHYDLRRFNNYSGNQPAIETIRFTLVPDANVRLMEVIAGNADVAVGLAPADLAGAEADPNVTLMRRYSMGVDLIWMNAKSHADQPRRDHNPLYHPLVRLALNYAFDTEAVVNFVFFGAGAVTHTALPTGAWGFVEQPRFTTNISRARELLIEAGYYPDGFDIEIWLNLPNVQRQQIAEMLQFALTPLNIRSEVVAMEWGEFLERGNAGEHDLMILGWTTVTGDADYGLFPLFHSSNFGMRGNRSFWYMPELDALLEAGRAEINPVVRAAIYADALRIIRENPPVIMLRTGEALVGVNPRMRNVVLSPTLHHNWGAVYFVN